MIRDYVVGFILSSLALGAVHAQSAKVGLVRTPNDGIQPQAAIDSRGTIHLIYYKGEAGGGDIFYVRREAGANQFSAPIQVNSRPHSAIAAGTIRGAQMALGRNGRVHVAWNGHAPEKGSWLDAPMLYTRLNDAGSGFEPERNVITSAGGLDGGGSVAADDQGNVFVMWHAPKPGNADGEGGRAVFVARSKDDGKTFAPEKLATSEATGACGCCGMKGFVDSHGNVFALYRAASKMTNRAETLLFSRNNGEDFAIAYSHNWNISSCPMSSAFLSETKTGVLAAAETHGRVFYVRVDSKSGKVSSPVSPEREAKHPVAVANDRGEVLLVWTEGTAWAKGGSVAWQIYDQEGNATTDNGRTEGVPTWSLATAVAKPDGTFLVIY
jgi:hypothetical protein